jgi:hypothetical protein
MTPTASDTFDSVETLVLQTRARVIRSVRGADHPQR